VTPGGNVLQRIWGKLRMDGVLCPVNLTRFQPSFRKYILLTNEIRQSFDFDMVKASSSMFARTI